MKGLKKAIQLIRNESKRPWSEVSSWALAPIGGASKFIAWALTLAVLGVMPGLIQATNEVGITALGVEAYSVVGLMALTAGHFRNVAKRCFELLYQRHYR
ncbi:hypothetical protein QEM42_003103 [Pseudomonas putida]|nr:hypothetical protein [Pseudomonas putida]